MTDIDVALLPDDTNQFDLAISNGDFALVDNFDTSLTTSLFTDARASSSEVLPAELRRGWWGDEVGEFQGYNLGSKIWLLYQARNTQQTLNDAIDFARASLQWFKQDQHLNDVQVTGIRLPEGIRLTIELIRGGAVTETRYYDLWENTGTSFNAA